MISRSRSTTRRVATLCTRPADSPGFTFFQATWRDVVAVEAVEQATGLLGVHQPHVQLAGVGDGLAGWPGR